MSLAFSKFSSTCQSFANSLDHLLEGGSRRSENKVVRFLGGLSEAMTNEHPMASIVLPLVQHGDDGPVEEPGACACLRSSRGVANPHREGRTLRPMQLLRVYVQLVSGSRRAHCRARPARRDTGVFPANSAGPDCHHKRYQLRPRK